MTSSDVAFLARPDMADDTTSSHGLGGSYRIAPTLTLATQGAGALREMILGGLLRPGQRLNEVELSAALGITRAPLREAIRHLASQGLLVTVTHKGAFVPSYTAQDLREIYEVRIALETRAAILVAERRPAADLAQLAALLDAAEAALDGGGAGAYPASLDFHREIVRLTGNQHLLTVAVTVDQKLQLARLRSGQAPARAPQALGEHRLIYRRLAAGDGAGAADLVARHLRNSLTNVLSIGDGAPAAPGDSAERTARE